MREAQPAGDAIVEIRDRRRCSARAPTGGPNGGADEPGPIGELSSQGRDASGIGHDGDATAPTGAAVVEREH